MRARKGYTLLETMITVAVLGAIAIGLFAFCAGRFNSDGNRTTANQEAQDFARQLYPGETARASCQGVDTDGNGYVSCTVVIGNHPPMFIECGSQYSIGNNGCRAIRPVVQQPQ